MNRFRFVAPRTLEHALELLNLHSGKTKILAGGTDLIPLMKKGRLSPCLFLDIKEISELHGIDKKDGKLVLGGLNSLWQLMRSPLVQKEIPYFVETLLTMGSFQVRCRATLAGNLCNASPAADTAPLLLALGASLILRSVEGSREVPLDRFFLNPGSTVLHPNEILTEVHIPLPGRETFGLYLKHTRRRGMDLAIVGVAILLRFSGGSCQEARLAFGGVAPTPIRTPSLEGMFTGKRITPQLIQEAREESKRSVSPISDLRASKEYRREMVGVFFERGLRKLLGEMEGRRDA